MTSKTSGGESIAGSNPKRTPNALLELALATLDEARNIVSFKAWPRTHRDWKQITPPKLQDLLQRQQAAESAIRKLEEDLPRRRGRVHSLERDAQRTRGLRLSRPSLIGIGPNGEASVPRDPLTQARAELESATSKLQAVRQSRGCITAELTSSSLLNHEETAVAGWLEEHACVFRSLHSEFVAAFEACENLLAGLPGQKRQTFGSWSGSSVCDVLRKIMDDVLDMLIRKEHAGQLTLLLHCADSLRDHLRIETASLIRITAHDSTRLLQWQPSEPFVETGRDRTPEGGAPPAGEGSDSRIAMGACLGDGGPARVLDAVGRAILARVDNSAMLHAGDETTLMDVAKHLDEAQAKKARDYLAPSGKLVKGGWIERDGRRVLLTALGAEDAMRRIQRPRRRDVSG